MSGIVYLVGAGPGDPRLVTRRAEQCLARADIVLYDALVNPILLELAPSSAEKLLVGKRQGRTTVSQEEIERLLVEHARAGKTVVRLKGGDPFIFGRGGEEAEACRAAGVLFEVVPGVTSATAVPAYAGIALTHREHASAVTFITGQPGEGRDLATYDWEALVRSRATLVFLMATLRAREIAARLIAAGMPPSTAAAAIRWGTTARQKTLRASIGGIGERIEAEHLRPPVILVVGSVAELADRLAWYERLPLFGRRVVVTRARHQAAELVDRLLELGAQPILFPTIELVDPPDTATVDRTLAAAASYDWLILTSANGADRFFKRFLAQGRDIRELAGVRVAVIGPGTEAAVERYGVRAAFRPQRFRAEAVADGIGSVAGKRLLLARAERAREVLPDTLRARGAEVDVIALYRTVTPGQPAPLDVLDDADVFTFTSASTVEGFFRIVGARATELLRAGVVAAIGPITAAALEREGVRPAVVAEPFTIPALVDGLVRYFANPQART